MTIENLPVWPFEPNWQSEVRESLEWLTDIITSPIGAEQRRALRRFPRRSIEFSLISEGKSKGMLDRLLTVHGARDWYLPVWHEVHLSEEAAPVGSNTLICESANIGEVVVGDIIFITDGDALNYELAEIGSISPTAVGLKAPLTKNWAEYTRFHPVRKARLTDQPEMRRITDDLSTATVRFISTQANRDVAVTVGADTDGPLLFEGLTAHSYQKIAPSPYLHTNSGDTDEHVRLINALLCAHLSLKEGNVSERVAANYYLNLAQVMSDAIGGTYQSAMLRQPFPDSVDSITLLHHSFAARGDVPEQNGLTRSTQIGEAHGLAPNWVKTPVAHAVSAKAAFREFDIAAARILATESRTVKLAEWTKTRSAMRKTALRAQDVRDGRDIFKPVAAFDVMSPTNEPVGTYCNTNHPAAVPPLAAGFDPTWLGYDLWSRDSNGDVVGAIPDTNELVWTRIGRVVQDSWRAATPYQQADQFLYVRASASRKPNAAAKEGVYVYLAESRAATVRYYAEIGSLAAFTARNDGSTVDFFIARTAFRQRTIDASGNTVWGATLPTGAVLGDFGMSFEMIGAYTIRIRNMRLVSDATEKGKSGSQIPFFPGSMPLLISADTRKQEFIGRNGNPMHGNQFPDHWWHLEQEAETRYPNLSSSDLPVPNLTTGAIEHPILTENSNGISKTANAMLMEQQLLFLSQAQTRWSTDGGTDGAFAHTFVTNTADRFDVAGEPHTWVYRNSGFETASVEHQVRIAESLGRVVLLTKGDVRFLDCHNIALDLYLRWYGFINAKWPNLAGQVVDGVRIYGMPTTFADPRTAPVKTEFESPLAAAVMLRAALWIEKAERGNVGNRAIMTRCWQYLELMWRTAGEMSHTWSPNPARKEIGAADIAEIINTLGEMASNPALVPPAIPIALVRQRLVDVRDWFERSAVRYQGATGVSILGDVYKGFGVVTTYPDEREELTYGFTRMISELDNSVGVPYRRDTAGIAFPRQRYDWLLKGRDENRRFRELMYSLRGRAVPIWLPTFSSDFHIMEPTPVNDSYIIVDNTGFTTLGVLSDARKEICIEMTDGTRLYREIVASTVSGSREILGVDVPFFEGLRPNSVLRISFMTLCRLDQDQVEIVHHTDTAGTSSVSTVFMAAPSLRRV